MTADTGRPTILIVNADDLGRTPGINEGTFEAHRRGVVTSATLMVNYAAAADAAAALPDHPDLGVGLHVALSGGTTALPPDQVRSLVDADGRLPAKPELLSDPDPAEVLAEVTAQLSRFEELTGRLPTHLDGHHHCHRLPVVADAVATVAARHNLPVRGVGADSISRMRADGIATPDRFDNRFYADGATLEGLLTILDELTPGVTEVMCHPARTDEPLRRGSSYADERDRELEVLTDQRIAQEVGRRGIRLAHYGVLSTATAPPR